MNIMEKKLFACGVVLLLCILPLQAMQDGEQPKKKKRLSRTMGRRSQNLKTEVEAGAPHNVESDPTPTKKSHFQKRSKSQLKLNLGTIQGGEPYSQSDSCLTDKTKKEPFTPRITYKEVEEYNRKQGWTTIRDSRSQTDEMLRAFENGDDRALRKIVEPVDFNRKIDEFGNRIIHGLICQNKYQILQALLGQPHIDVNIANDSGNTALHVAAMHGYQECLDLLLAHHSIQLGSRNRSGDTPLHLACRYFQIPAIHSLLDAMRDKDENYINSKNDVGEVALHAAVSAGCREGVLGLIKEKRCDRNRANDFGNTPLHFAAHYFYTVDDYSIECLAILLLDLKVCIAQENNEGEVCFFEFDKAFEMAQSNNNDALIEALVSKKNRVEQLLAFRKVLRTCSTIEVEQQKKEQALEIIFANPFHFDLSLITAQ